MSRSSDARRRKSIRCPEITGWLHAVESGEVPACVEQRQLAEYVRRVFAVEELVIDYDRIAAYMAYQKYFPFELLPWEKFCFTLFMCVFKADGTPRWDQEFIYVGRGAGKNGFDAFTAFCALTKVNGIQNYDVDICANSEEQAKTSFLDIYDILENSPTAARKKFKRGFEWNKEQITCRSTHSTLKYRTDNPKSKDGLRSGMVIFDEVHQYEDFRNIKVFTTGLGKKPCPRRLYTTTDGDVRGGVLDSLLDKSRRILSGETADNGFLPFICKLDEAAEVHDPASWPKANPSLPAMPTLVAEIKSEYADFTTDPASNADFMTKRMNLPSGNPDIEVASWDDIMATDREMPDLRGLPCVCGIDFAKTNDFIAAVLLFHVDGVYYVKHHSWVCTASKDIPRIRAPLDEWAQRGLLDWVDDVEVHPALICDWIADQGLEHEVLRVSIDSYRHGFLMRELDQLGFSAKDKTITLTRPSNVMKMQPLINSAFVNHEIVWGDDPMMRWYTNNAKLVGAPHGNYTYGKIEPKSRKTDGFMAFVAAMCAVDVIPEDADIDFVAPIIF